MIFILFSRTVFRYCINGHKNIGSGSSVTNNPITARKTFLSCKLRLERVHERGLKL